MIYEKRIRNAFTKNNIKRVLLIDDSYDPPSLDDEELLEILVDFLTGTDCREILDSAGISNDDAAAAKKAAKNEDTDSKYLKQVNSALYRKFMMTRDRRFDPCGRFEYLKGTALNALAPLNELLKKCVDKKGLRYAGLDDGREVYRREKPQIIFLDYYLSSDQHASEGNQNPNSAAREESINIMNKILESPKDEVPSIVLMSSSSDARRRAERFRQDIMVRRGNPLALRFRFLRKNWVNQYSEGGEIEITDDAADALLDTAQGFTFGQELQRALGEWRKGAEDAMEASLREISGLEPKDFAYLFRFRLDSERAHMSDYLRWMFGENLRAHVDENISRNRRFSTCLDKGKSKLGEGIEGAFEGTSVRIAKIFNRIRIDTRAAPRFDQHKLGDIYVYPKEKRLRVVVTPDCDLVYRNENAKVSRLLTMGGELQTFDQHSASADQFVIYDRKPYSLRWIPKDLETFPIEGTGSLCAHPEYKYFGTLRPLYAQDMQRQLSVDLSRVGLAVAPVIGIDAKVATWLRVKNGEGSEFEEVEIEKGAVATLLIERGDAKSGHRVLLRRKYLSLLFHALNKIEQNKLLDDDKSALLEFLKGSNVDQITNKFLAKGLYTKTERMSGPGFAISKKPNKKKDSPWLQFLLEVPEKAMEELATIDPTLLSAEASETESGE